MRIKTRNPGIYQTLITQLDKTARHNRQGSFRTKERYYEAMQRFCKFLSEEYRLQKLANINGKHLTAYVLYMQERDKSASTIKTDLAAIRFFHDKMERTKYRLSSNDELAVELERRRFGGETVPGASGSSTGFWRPVWRTATRTLPPSPA